MNILCTGGTGFVGTWMKKTQPEDLTVWYSSHNDYAEKIYAWEIGDWDMIIHLAPISPSRVLKYAQKHKIKVLFASSGAVYEGMGEYAYHKRLWEAECIHSNIDVVIARLFATSGLPFQKNKALSIFIQSALRGWPIQVWGNGSTVRSYLYGEDVGRWFWKILLQGEGTYDVGSMIPCTMFRLANLVAQYAKTKIEFIEHEEMPTPTYYVPENVQRALELGCKETIGLKEAVKRMVKNG